jgi:hypothetical protein
MSGFLEKSITIPRDQQCSSVCWTEGWLPHSQGPATVPSYMNVVHTCQHCILRHILILCSHLYLGILSSPLPSDFTTTNSHASVVTFVCVTCSERLTDLDLIILIALVERINFEAHLNAISPAHWLFFLLLLSTMSSNIQITFLLAGGWETIYKTTDTVAVCWL